MSQGLHQRYRLRPTHTHIIPHHHRHTYYSDLSLSYIIIIVKLDRLLVVSVSVVVADTDNLYNGDTAPDTEITSLSSNSEL